MNPAILSGTMILGPADDLDTYGDFVKLGMETFARLAEGSLGGRKRETLPLRWGREETVCAAPNFPDRP